MQSTTIAALVAAVVVGSASGGYVAFRTTGGDGAADDPSQTPTAGATTGTTGRPAEYVRRDDTATAAAFVSPTGNLRCSMQPDSDIAVSCTAGQHTWKDDRACGPQDFAIALDATGLRDNCHTDVLSCYSALIQEQNFCGGDDNMAGLWWRRDGDPTYTDPGSETPLAVLPYFSSIVIGSYECVSDPEAGVTCTDHATGYGFAISRERLKRITP